MRSGANRTSAMTVKIKAPGASAYTTYTYAKAKAYKFSKPGQYAVQYSVKNTNKPYRAATKEDYDHGNRKCKMPRSIHLLKL